MNFFQQFADESVAFGLRGISALFGFRKAVFQSIDEQQPAASVVQQIVLQIGVALDGPNVAQHFVNHAGGAAGAALAPQFPQNRPRVASEKARHDFFVGKRRVVVGNLSDSFRGGRSFDVFVLHDQAGKIEIGKNQLEALRIRRRRPFSMGRSTRW